MIQVKIENVGALKSTDISICKPITLLLGPNNSGKTYAATILYSILSSALSNSIRYVFPASIRRKRISDSTQIDINIDLQKFNDIDYVLGKYIEILISHFELTINDKADIESFLSDVLSSGKVNFKDAKFSVKYIQETLCFRTKRKQKLRQRKLFDEKIENYEDKIFLLEEVIAFNFRNNPPLSTYFFPAERSAILMFSKELSIRRNDTLDELVLLESRAKSNKAISTMSNLIRRRANRYPKPITDALRIAESYDTLTKEISEYELLAKELESLFNARISINEFGSVEFSLSDGETRPFHLASSMIKSLASLVLYTKHFAKYGDFVFIDEPELNLHPDNQILIARWLAKLANGGINLIISTHSDYIIREFNNLVMLYSVKKNKLSSGMSEHLASAIDIKAIDVYYFDDGSSIKLEVDNIGFSVPSIDLATDSQNDVTDELISLIDNN